jgi:proteic killer suppression protein
MLHFYRDQDLPASRYREVLQDRIKVGHPTEARLRILLTTLNLASTPLDMKRDGWKWHPLKGDLKGHCSVSVSGNWRLTFTFEGEDAILVDYQDYH